MFGWNALNRSVYAAENMLAIVHYRTPPCRQNNSEESWCFPSFPNSLISIFWTGVSLSQSEENPAAPLFYTFVILQVLFMHGCWATWTKIIHLRKQWGKPAQIAYGVSPHAGKMSTPSEGRTLQLRVSKTSTVKHEGASKDMHLIDRWFIRAKRRRMRSDQTTNRATG